MYYKIEENSDETLVAKNGLIERILKKKNENSYHAIIYKNSATDSGSFVPAEDENRRWRTQIIRDKWAEKWGDGEEPFTEWFVQTYVTVRNESKEQKIKNFRKKRKFVWYLRLLALVQFLFLAGVLVFCCSHDSFALKAELFLALETGIILLCVLIFLPLVKQMDIMKHQETWARLSFQRELIELEMLRFIHGTDPYEGQPDDKQRKIFMSRCIEIEEKSIENFRKMLQEQEKGMVDGLGGLIKH